MYEEKNERVIKAIGEKQPYWLLVDNEHSEDWYYALIQIGSDRIPVPILSKLLGEDDWPDNQGLLLKIIGYEPELILHRDVKICDSKSILTDIVNAMLASSEGTHDEPYYSVSAENARITIGFPEDSSKSDNGGDYYYYRDYEITSQGVIAENSWSCDFSSYSYTDQIFYKIDLSDLQSLFERSLSIVKQITNGEKISVCPTCGHPYTHSSH
jgi:hypothetical protein